MVELERLNCKKWGNKNVTGKDHSIGRHWRNRRYKAAYLASALHKQGCIVHVLMTQNATNFINPITFESLTGNKCLVDTFDRNFEFQVEHVSLAKAAISPDRTGNLPT